MYDLGDGLLLMVASDRVSAFDVVMREPVPGKGARADRAIAVLVRKRARTWCPTTVSDDPRRLAASAPELAEACSGRWMLVRRAERIDIECVVRGYLAGSGWAEYRRTGTLAGEQLPAGLREADRLEKAVFTPAIKADTGHDENISRARLREIVGV